MDRTLNKSGDLEYYTDLEVRTGTQWTNLRFFLSDLGDNKAILGYPWFAAVQPKIDWLCRWLDHSQLPIIFCAPDAAKAQFTPCTRNILHAKKIQQIYMGRITIGAATDQTVLGVPKQYTQFTKVFSKEESHNFPPVRIWDHAIELKPGAPATIPGKIYSLSQTEQEETHEFIKGHLKQGTIRPSKGPYAAPFFYIRKKDGKLCPIQDYRRLNKWTIRNRSPLPLIPQLIDRLRGCTLYTKFNIQWGYNNVRIKDRDQ
jgi:hypothetical protein